MFLDYFSPNFDFPENSHCKSDKTKSNSYGNIMRLKPLVFYQWNIGTYPVQEAYCTKTG